MTRQSDFKTRVRARMARTGERYAAARAMVIAGTSRADEPRALPAPPGLLEGYDRFGGVHAESALLANVLRHAGVVAASTGKPWKESSLFGLCGGVGFMYFAFEYTGHQPMLSLALRSDSYPDAFVRRGLERSGAGLEWHETGSPAVAARHLDESLSTGRAAICVTDLAGLPWYGFPAEYRGYAPRYVGVVGRSDNVVILDDRAPRPLVIAAESLADARAGYRKGKHRLVTAAPATGTRQDPSALMLDAIRGTIRGFHEAPYSGYGSNFGLAGLEKWSRLISSRTDAKGWRRLLATGPALATALARMYEGAEYENTAPAGGRPLYADFLDEAALITGRPALRGAADLYRAAGAQWRAFGEAALPDADPVLGSLRGLIDERSERIDSLGEGAAGPNRDAQIERVRLERAWDPVPDVREAILAALEGIAVALVRLEKEAIGALEAAVA